jgi:mycothiol synthase
MRLSAPGPEDAARVFEVILARDLADLGFADFTLEDLHEEWSRSEFDLAADAVVCMEDADNARSILGYASLRRTHGFAIVTPGQEGRGIGTLLLGWLQERERELGRTHHRQAIASTDTRGERLLLEAGYSWERSYFRMRRRLEDLPPIASLPATTLRELDLERDAHAVYATDAESFSESPDYEPMSFATFVEEHLEGHDFTRELSTVAESEGRLIGFLLARRWHEEQAGFIAVLAVSPPRQGHGVGTALVLDAFERFASAGLTEAQLGVASSNPRALKLYERLGMTPRFRIDTYARNV